jgi:hypothetical protein
MVGAHENARARRDAVDEMVEDVGRSAHVDLAQWSRRKGTAMRQPDLTLPIFALQKR